VTANRGKSTLYKASTLVEEVLREVGLDPERDRIDPVEDGFASWLFYSNFSAVYIDLYTHNEWNYISVMAPLFAVPERETHRLYEKLCELNHALFGCAYSLFDNSVFVGYRREIENLHKAELQNTLKRITFYADEALQTVAKEFNCLPHETPHA